MTAAPQLRGKDVKKEMGESAEALTWVDFLLTLNGLSPCVSRLLTSQDSLACLHEALYTGATSDPSFVSPRCLTPYVQKLLILHDSLACLQEALYTGSTSDLLDFQVADALCAKTFDIVRFAGVPA